MIPNACCYLDLTHGLGGDMVLAALADAGLDLTPLATMCRDAGLAHTVEARHECRRGVAGRLLHIETTAAQPLRHLPQIQTVLDALPLSQDVRRRSHTAFQRLAETEAHVHGCSVERIHFHEVGAVDTIIDVVGAFWAMETLGVEEVVATSIPWFTGTVRCEHGVIPLPSPAAVKLLHGKPVHPTPFTHEAVTPTGALVLDQLVTRFETPGAAKGPRGVLRATGLGYGSLDIGEDGGGLRVFLLQAENAEPTADDLGRLERVWTLETHLDTLTGEELAHAMAGVMEAGALDVIALQGVMKKGRPAVALRVLCDDDAVETVERRLFAETLTLGVRRVQTERRVLPRRSDALPTPWGELAAKTAILQGEEYTAPEDDALAALARAHGVTVAALRRKLLGRKA